MIAVPEKPQDLVISYAGSVLQEPDIFPQPSGYDSLNLSSMTILNTIARKPLSAPELVDRSSSLSAHLVSSTMNLHTLGPSEIEPFLQDLRQRFGPDNELDGILGPVVRFLLFHILLFRPESLSGGFHLARCHWGP